MAWCAMKRRAKFTLPQLKALQTTDHSTSLILKPVVREDPESDQFRSASNFHAISLRSILMLRSYFHTSLFTELKFDY